MKMVKNEIYRTEASKIFKYHSEGKNGGYCMIDVNNGFCYTISKSCIIGLASQPYERYQKSDSYGYAYRITTERQAEIN